MSRRPTSTGRRVIGAAIVLAVVIAVWVLLPYNFGAEPWPLRPDRELTPGAAPRDLTIDQVCDTKWGKDARAVTEAMKERVFAAYFARYGARPRLLPNGRPAFEVDHDKSRELAGADVIENLWIQSYTGSCNAHDKDRLENRLHVEACQARTIEALAAAQAEIAAGWIAAYEKRFGTCMR